MLGGALPAESAAVYRLQSIETVARHLGPSGTLSAPGMFPFAAVWSCRIRRGGHSAEFRFRGVDSSPPLPQTATSSNTGRDTAAATATRSASTPLPRGVSARTRKRNPTTSILQPIFEVAAGELRQVRPRLRPAVGTSKRQSPGGNHPGRRGSVSGTILRARGLSIRTRLLPQRALPAQTRRLRKRGRDSDRRSGPPPGTRHTRPSAYGPRAAQYIELVTSDPDAPCASILEAGADTPLLPIRAVRIGPRNTPTELADNLNHTTRILDEHGYNVPALASPTPYLRER